MTSLSSTSYQLKILQPLSIWRAAPETPIIEMMMGWGGANQVNVIWKYFQ